MTIEHKITANFGLKVVSLCLALLVWLVAISGMETETGIKVPVRYRNLSPGMTIGNAPPKVVEVTVAGPKILLWRLGTDCPVLTDRSAGGRIGEPHSCRSGEKTPIGQWPPHHRCLSFRNRAEHQEGGEGHSLTTVARSSDTLDFTSIKGSLL